MDPARALGRLRDPSDPALDDLARQAADWFAERPVREVLDPAVAGRLLARGLRSVGGDPSARDRLVARLDAERARWAREERPLRTWLVPEAHAATRAVLAQPWVPSEDLVYRLVDQEAVRSLLAEVLQAALSRFAGRVRSLDQGLLGGLGGRVARKGKGLLGVARELGAAADGLVGGLRDEVEQALDRRVREQLGSATDEAVRGIATWIASPEHAGALASLRLSVLEVALDLSLGELLGEVDEVGSEALVDAVLDALRAAGDRPGLADDLGGRLADVIGAHGEATLGALLDDLGLRQAWHETLAEAVVPQARALVATQEFEAWWSALFR